MRIAVLSDIHGNYPALEAVIADMAQFDVEHVVVAGDNINWAPFSTQVIERLISEPWAVIRGNHEFYLLELDTPDIPDYRRHWTMPQALKASIPTTLQHVIAALPDQLTLHYDGVPPIRVFHASPQSHWVGFYESTPDTEIAERLADVPQSTVIVGHTHLQMNRHAGKWQILNPGSVGTPLNGIPGAYYMLLDGDANGWIPTFRHVTYDPTPIFDELERINFIEQHGATGRLVMEEIRIGRPCFWGYHQWCAANNDVDDVENVALAEEFLAHPTALFDYLHPEYHLNLPDLNMNGRGS